jgi:hypothetical protein
MAFRVARAYKAARVYWATRCRGNVMPLGARAQRAELVRRGDRMSDRVDDRLPVAAGIGS